MNKLLIANIFALCAWAASTDAAANPVSNFPIVIDGQFTGGLVDGVVQGEWSDFTPQAFIAPPDATGTLQATTLGDMRANSLLYAGLAPESINGPVKSLYLMYAYRDLTERTFAPGKLIFHVTFPVTFEGSLRNVDVRLLGTGQAAPFYRVEVLANGAVVPPGIVIANGEAAAGFGPSPLSASPHFLMELEVSLRIDPGFGTPGGPFPPGGEPNGVYPVGQPLGWQASAANNFVDPPISAALFTIQPDGSTMVDVSQIPQAVPEPSAFVLFGLGLATFAVHRRRMNVSVRPQPLLTIRA